MNTLTIAERIMLHLGRFDMVDPDELYNIPWDLTQDGVASSLRISRAHASIELKKLKIAGKVDERHTHIKGGKGKRKSYSLTPLGLNEAKRIRDYAEKEGLDIMPLLDMKRCDPNTLLDSMDEENRNVLGLACILRCSVRRDTLPETRQSIVPVDVHGNVIISDEVKKNVINALNPDDIPRLHSAAADYWISVEGTDRHERLYHLVMAGRIRDACRLLMNERSDFTEVMDEDLYDTMMLMTDIPEKYLADVLPIKIMSAMEFDDLDSARSSIELLMPVNKISATLFLADLALISGLPDDALEILSKIPSDNISSKIRKAKALTDLGRLDEAKDLLEDVRKNISNTGDLGHLVDVYLCLSTICIRMGVPDDAIPYLNKAKGSAGPREMRHIFKKMAEIYEAKGMAPDPKKTY